MPKVNISNMNNYGGGGKYKKINYLSLPEDGSTAEVHFLIDNEDDLNECLYVTHNVKLKSAPKLKYGVRVNCLREYNDPIKNCPFCEAGYQTQISCVLPVYNEETEQVEFWTRGKKEANRLLRKLSKAKNPFSTYTWELTRIGAPGDQTTDYEYENLGADEDFDMAELDIPEILGGPVLDKSFDDMEYYLNENDFPPEEDEEDEEDEEPVRRRSSRKEQSNKNSKSRRVPEDDEDEEDVPFEEDDEDEEDVKSRRKATGGRKARRRTPEEEF